MGIFRSLPANSIQLLTPGLVEPSDGLMLSQMAAVISLPSGVLSSFVGTPAMFVEATRYRFNSEIIHPAPRVAPSSAPIRIRLLELQSPLSLRRSRYALAAAMSFTRAG